MKWERLRHLLEKKVHIMGPGLKKELELELSDSSLGDADGLRLSDCAYPGEEVKRSRLLRLNPYYLRVTWSLESDRSGSVAGGSVIQHSIRHREPLAQGL